MTAADAARLVLVPAESRATTVPAHGFTRFRYRVVQPPQAAAVRPDFPELPPRVAGDGSPAHDGGETVVASGNGSSSGFLERFAPYEPIYGVISAGAAAKLQVSFAFRPFAGDGPLSRFTFAYTQTMFWRLDQVSGPIRPTTYSPEAFFDMPLADDLHVALGYRHDSNGEALPGSIDVNRIRLRVTRGFDLGGGWRAELTPEGWAYFGDQGRAPDLVRYWGHAALHASVMQRDGLKLAMSVRGSTRSGRGAIEGYLSYPLGRIAGGLGIYLFGQGFAGYGEALDGYNIRDAHGRIGIALTR